MRNCVPRFSGPFTAERTALGRSIPLLRELQATVNACNFTKCGKPESIVDNQLSKTSAYGVPHGERGSASL